MVLTSCNKHLISLALLDSFPSRGSLQKSTHLWVANNRCMAGRPIKSAYVAPPVKGRAMPENEKPPAMRVDIYFVIILFDTVNTLTLLTLSDKVNIIDIYRILCNKFLRADVLLLFHLRCVN